MPNSPKTIYWKYVKKEHRFLIQQTQPKSNRIYWVAEDYEKVDFQHYWHFLNGCDGQKCDMESVCGYDRGVRLPNLLKLMMTRRNNNA